jgi:leucyl aminopeptidase
MRIIAGIDGGEIKQHKVISMADSSKQRTGRRRMPDHLGLPARTWLEQAVAKSTPRTAAGHMRVWVVDDDASLDKRLKDLRELVPAWQAKGELIRNNQLTLLSTRTYPLVVANLVPPSPDPLGMLQNDTRYAFSRDCMGQLYDLLEMLDVRQLKIDFRGCQADTIVGCLVGLELAAYDYRRQMQDRQEEMPVPGLNIDVPEDLLRRAMASGLAVNVARHLVNLPAADLNPKRYAGLLQSLFRKSRTCKVGIWDAARLRREKLGLMLAVGGAAENGPYLVNIRYRKRSTAESPIALVGKGITFDSGGLDIKPAAFMRQMKKDMGGSAALAGLAVWLDRTEPDVAVDIWLAIAENAVSAKSFRPGDILRAHDGKSVEIDNTDAEGRLVLADALSVALSARGKSRPRALIDVATLTGAARVALGLRVGALFASDPQLAQRLQAAGQQAGDPLWQMPLVKDYERELRSNVAELVNSSTSRYAGAVTAAMFLAQFTGGVPWAHIDVNAWTNDDQGPIRGPAGNGQAVQCLIQYLLDEQTS